MNYTIIGAGAIGGVVGVALHEAGHSVTMVEANPDHRAAIARDGLQISGFRESTTRLKVIAPEDLLPGQERVLLAVKAPHTNAAIDLLKGKLAEDGFIVSLQNGLNEYALAEAFGAYRVIGAYLTFGGFIEAPGKIRYAGEGSFRVGEVDGTISPRVEELAAHLRSLQACEVTDNIFGYLWAKMVVGAVYYGTAVLDRDVRDIYADPDAIRLLSSAAREGAEIARLNDVRLVDVDGFSPDAFADDDPARIAASWDAQRAYWGGHTGGVGRTGVWRDLAVHHRKTECSEHVGAITRRRGNHPTPTLDRIAQCVAEIEAGTRTVGWENLAFLTKTAN
ncbi:hypothetical protein GHV40_19975 [Devosia sp. D6-9]|nr:hypothetical protein GHV40_19975 [Devosia sp. D6-9]